MDFNMKGWGWVGDIYHKFESLIQEVDDIVMEKEKDDSVEKKVQNAGENMTKFSFVEVQAALQQVEELHPPATNEKKPDPCLNKIDDTAANKFFKSADVHGEHVQLHAEQSGVTRSLVDYVGQDSCEPPTVGILGECDKSDDGHTEAISNWKSIFNCGDESAQIIIKDSQATQSSKNHSDQKESQSVPAQQVVNSDHTHSSERIALPPETGDMDRPSAIDMTRKLLDDELEDSGSSIPFLVDSPKQQSFQSQGIRSNSALSDMNGDISNVKATVLESSDSEAELLSLIEEDLYKMLLTASVVNDKYPNEHECIANSLTASPMICNESHLHLEIGKACAKIGIYSGFVTHASSASLESTWSVTDAGGLPIPVTDLLEKEDKQLHESGASCDHLVDTNMETIDLDEKGELQENCTGVDFRDLFAVSERVKTFRSLKRKILDAFASRRRTAKEYEQLGIWHGDINFEDSSHVMPHSASPLDNRSSQEHLCDLDWELL